MSNLFVSFLLLFLQTNVIHSFNCDNNERRGNCHCYSGRIGYQMACPSNSPTELKVSVMVRKGPKGRLATEITCKDDVTEEDIKVNLKGLNIGEIPNLKIENCPLISGGFGDVITSFGGFPSSVKVLKVISMKHNANNTILARHFIELPNLTYLELKNSGIRRLSGDLFNFTRNLLYLDMTGNKIDHIDENVFHHLVNLKRLILSNSNLKYLLGNIFRNLSNLVALNLYDNHLKEIPSQVFVDLIGLTQINLGFNELKHLPYKVFDTNTNLRDITVNCNSFETLPYSLLGGKKKLKTFTYRNTGHQCQSNSSGLALPENMFAHSAIENIDFAGIPITAIPSSLLRGCSSLQRINIIGSDVDHIPDDIFKDTLEVREIRLINSNIYVVSEKVFYGLNKLTTIDLSGNKISHWTSTMLSIPNLKILKMSRNHLSIIEDGAFESVKSLEHLDLSFNHLSSEVIHYTSYSKFQQNVFENVSKAETNSNDNIFEYKSLRKIKVIKLNNNYLTKFEIDWINDSSDLKYLDLSNNFILGTILPLDLAFSQNKITVNIKNNSINRIIFSSSTEMRNTKFHLSGNPIKCDCFATELKEKIIRKDKDVTFDDFPCLEISYEELVCPLPYENIIHDSCPSQFACNYNRYYQEIFVNCSNRNLKKIPEFNISMANFAPNTRISLTLNNNNISDLDVLSDIRGTEIWDKITHLHLSRNFISEINHSLLPPLLSVLSINDNFIKTLSRQTFQYLQNGNLKILRLGQNPFNCDCASLDLLDFVQYFYFKVSDRDNISFDCSPRKFFLHNVKTHLDICPDNTMYIISRVSIIVMVIIALIVYVVSQWTYVLIWLYNNSWSRILFSAELMDKDKDYDVFISYSHHQAEFVEKVLWKNLESPESPDQPNYKCCIHTRDFIPGQMIPDQIVNKINKSRRTIIVLSKEYCEGTWTRLEFKTAFEQSVKDRTQRLILVVPGDLPPLDHLESNLSRHIQLNTHINATDKSFWKKLRFSLPHKKHVETKDLDDMLQSVATIKDLSKKIHADNNNQPDIVKSLGDTEKINHV